MTRLSALYLRKSNLAMDLLVLIATVTPLFHDWKVIILFYSTLYRIQEYAAANGHKMPKRHWERWKYVEEHLPEIVDVYDALYNMSITARYNPEEEITGECVKIARDLRQYVLSAIS